VRRNTSEIREDSQRRREQGKFLLTFIIGVKISLPEPWMMFTTPGGKMFFDR